MRKKSVEGKLLKEIKVVSCCYLRQVGFTEIGKTGEVIQEAQKHTLLLYRLQSLLFFHSLRSNVFVCTAFSLYKVTGHQNLTSSFESGS